mmetsp:Transcript_89441/g.255416  ORF Transcript_89441/g.255416 Transcript_89441/m.255416 type:complete len:925 (-) Transcript_89441:294-3068(-)
MARMKMWPRARPFILPSIIPARKRCIPPLSAAAQCRHSPRYLIHPACQTTTKKRPRTSTEASSAGVANQTPSTQAQLDTRVELTQARPTSAGPARATNPKARPKGGHRVQPAPSSPPTWKKSSPVQGGKVKGKGNATPYANQKTTPIRPQSAPQQRSAAVPSAPSSAIPKAKPNNAAFNFTNGPTTPGTHRSTPAKHEGPAALTVVGGKMTCTIHVKGLGIKEKHLGRQVLKDIFTQYGAVNSVKLQSLSGFAFIEFESAEAAGRALADPLKMLGEMPCTLEPWVSLWTNCPHVHAGSRPDDQYLSSTSRADVLSAERAREEERKRIEREVAEERRKKQERMRKLAEENAEAQAKVDALYTKLESPAVGGEQPGTPGAPSTTESRRRFMSRSAEKPKWSTFTRPPRGAVAYNPDLFAPTMEGELARREAEVELEKMAQSRTQSHREPSPSKPPVSTSAGAATTHSPGFPKGSGKAQERGQGKGDKNGWTTFVRPPRGAVAYNPDLFAPTMEGELARQEAEALLAKARAKARAKVRAKATENGAVGPAATTEEPTLVQAQAQNQAREQLDSRYDVKKPDEPKGKGKGEWTTFTRPPRGAVAYNPDLFVPTMEGELLSSEAEVNIARTRHRGGGDPADPAGANVLLTPAKAHAEKAQTGAEAQQDESKPRMVFPPVIDDDPAVVASRERAANEIIASAAEERIRRAEARIKALKSKELKEQAEFDEFARQRKADAAELRRRKAELLKEREAGAYVEEEWLKAEAERIEVLEEWQRNQEAMQAKVKALEDEKQSRLLVLGLTDEQIVAAKDSEAEAEELLEHIRKRREDARLKRELIASLTALLDEKDEEAVRAIGAASAATQRGVELEAEFAALEAKLRQSLVAKAEDEILARAKATVDTAAARVLETERLVLRRDREPPPAEPAW